LSLAAIAPPSAIPPEGEEKEKREAVGPGSFVAELSAGAGIVALIVGLALAARAAHHWLALFAMGIAVVVIANDFSAINVALPTMERTSTPTSTRSSGWSTPTR
jgi:hypothetical protein